MTSTLDQQNWGLAESPFGGGLQQLFFQGASAGEALARMRYLRANRRIGLLSGTEGAGKTQLLRVFEKDCRQQEFAVANISLQGKSAREFYCELGSVLGCPLRLDDEQPRLFRQVADRLAENAIQGISSVLLLDDVHLAGPDLIAQLLRLAKLRDSLTLPPAMVLTSNKADLDRLPATLVELVDLRVEIEPWDELDTIGYLQLALVEAGCQHPLFDDKSLSEIYRLTGGVPRKVNRLADSALLIGSADAPEIIDSETILTAHEALSPPSRT